MEKITSLCLLVMLVFFIGCRLFFAYWWPVPVLDFALSAVAAVLGVGVLWFARDRRGWRLCAVGCASATQLVPMVCREPVLLLPLVGALVPFSILLACLVALSRKGSPAAAGPAD